MAENKVIAVEGKVLLFLIFLGHSFFVNHPLLITHYKSSLKKSVTRCCVESPLL
jgi:hypothetical protein